MPDRNGKIFYTSFTSLSHINKDASIVATHMMLAAYNEGIDSCWINFFNPDELAKALGLPEEEEILMLLDLGIAADGTGALPNHNSRKELTETISYM